MSVVSLAEVRVFATQGRGHTAEEWSQMLVDRIIGETKNAPEPIRLQAEAFKEKIHQEILWHMREAIKSDRCTLAGKLERADLATVAEIIRSF